MSTRLQTDPGRFVEDAVRERYGAGAKAVEPALCCPVKYDPAYLAAIPDEVIERDYGCGDPTPFVRPGDTVLDLGAGGGKVCFIAAQVAGARGRVIGVDCNPDMLALARRNKPEVARRLGYDNVEFRNGMIQDLGLDLDRLATDLGAHPVVSVSDWHRLRSAEARLRREHPLVPDESVDCVVSNCVLNLVRPEDRRQLFAEIFRVLNRHGRAAISDIVADEDVPDELRRNPELWSGCISGAFREDQFLKAFEDAGFHGIELVKRERQPWRVVGGIEFRSVTVLAHKGKQGPCLERNQALVYRGPFKAVEDDDGHRFVRGERIAVCDKTFHLLRRDPYGEAFEPVEPLEVVPPDQAGPFDCKRSARRHPRETKGQNYDATTESAGGCSGQACC
jgi:SAM-dependent methyltransferase